MENAEIDMRAIAAYLGATIDEDAFQKDLLGEDLFLWGCQFFCKLPGVSTDVPWHQDAQYWPLTPRETIMPCFLTLP